MSNKRYPEEFKIEAVKQVTVAGHRIAERLGMTTHSLNAWIKRYGPDSITRLWLKRPRYDVLKKNFSALLKSATC